MVVRPCTTGNSDFIRVSLIRFQRVIDFIITLLIPIFPAIVCITSWIHHFATSGNLSIDTTRMLHDHLIYRSTQPTKLSR